MTEKFIKKIIFSVFDYLYQHNRVSEPEEVPAKKLKNGVDNKAEGNDSKGMRHKSN